MYPQSPSRNMLLRMALVLALFSTIHAGYCEQEYNCPCYKSQVYYKSCGLFGWGSCASYRAVSQTCVCTKDICCPGYSGTDCDEPLCFGTTVCPNNGTCSSPDTCICHSGYESPNCSELDECTSNTSNCEQNCLNTQGSYECLCDAGFSLDMNGTSCSDINECDVDNGGCDHTCINEIGSFTCSCRDGYSLHNDTASCVDENECENNNGGCQHICTNTEFSYNCSCYEGYAILNDNQSCDDINECDIDNGNCEHYCRNENGSFTCDCSDGFVLHNNSVSCVDVNECENNVSDCEQTCTNTVGSFYCGCMEKFSLNDDSSTCSCSEGYTLYIDNATCKDINECEEENGSCDQICKNEEGTFSCYCAKGYALHSDERSCLDIVECSINNGGCQQQCINLQGSFSCKCGKGFALNEDGFTCKNITGHSVSSSVILLIDFKTASHLMVNIFNLADITSDTAIAETTRKLIHGHFEKYTSSSFSIIVRHIRKISNVSPKQDSMVAIIANFTVVYEKEDELVNVRDQLIRRTTDLLGWKTLSYNGMKALAKLDMAENISSVCDVFSRLVGGCEDGFRCAGSDEGPICKYVEPPGNENVKERLIVFVVPVVVVVAVVTGVIIVSLVIRKRRKTLTHLIVNYRRYGSAGHGTAQNVYENPLSEAKRSKISRKNQQIARPGDVENDIGEEAMYSEIVKEEPGQEDTANTKKSG